MLARFTQVTVKVLDKLAERYLPPSEGPVHQRMGRRGEEDAYFYLRKRGYVMAARNYRSPRRRGEVDLIGWEDDVLCFIEVKTRTSREVKPAEAAVDREKQRELSAMAREYLRRVAGISQWRFDVVSVYYEGRSGHPTFELFKNAFRVS
jgi:putative endonuclease